MKLLDWTRGHFDQAGVDSPRLCAEILLAHVLGCQRIELYARFDYTPDDDQLAAYRQFVRRAAEHEPVAYLVGEKEFYSLKLVVTPDVLIPRPETELIVAEAVEFLRSLGRPGFLWDACTGSGCAAVAVAHQLPDVTVLATDISPEAVAVAAENARRHGVDGRVQTAVADLLDRPAGSNGPALFDVISANPPYVADSDPVAECVKREPPVALYAGKDGLKFIRRLIAAAPEHLAVGGAFIMEFGCGQGDAVRDLIADSEQLSEPHILEDHQQLERTAVAVRTQ